MRLRSFEWGRSALAPASLVLLSLATISCTHSIHEVQVSDFQPYAAIERGDVVKGYAEQFVVLGITQDSNYVNEAVRQLSAACDDGIVSGITTQISTSHGFFSWTNKALVQGLCLKRQASRGDTESATKVIPKRERPRRPAKTSGDT